MNVIANAVEWLGFRARLVVADTYGAAWALARFGRDTRLVVPEDAHAGAVSPLPVSALRLEPDVVETLDGINVETVGDLLAIPRLELASRFGPAVLRRLDQMTGETGETLVPLRPRERPHVARTFDGPVKQTEAIDATVRTLLDELIAILERRERGVCRLDVTFDRVDAPPERATIRCSRPTRRPAHLWALLAPKLERMHLGYGVETVHLDAVAHAALRHEQQAGAWGRHGEAIVEDDARRTAWLPALGELVDAFASRWGEARTYRLAPVGSHQPERAARLVPLAPHATPDELAFGGGFDGLGRPPTPDTALARHPRPSRLLARPEPIEVMALSPDGPPSWMRWDDVAGPVRACDGPERIAGTWWDGSVIPPDADPVVTSDATLAWLTRDYYRVQDDAGRWVWIFRELETGRWYAHGVWA